MRALRSVPILGVLALSLAAAGCQQRAELSPRPGPEEPRATVRAPEVKPQTASIEKMEARVVERVNEIRLKQGLKPLERNDALAKVARDYSRLMAKEEFFSHFSPAGEAVTDRVRKANLSYSIVAENIFKSVNAPNPVDLAIHGWMESKGHRENILREGVTQTGVGIWKEGNTYYFTQVFMRPR